jgi:hypothetical protein
MKRLLLAVAFVLSFACAAEAYYPPYHYRGHTYSAATVNGYYLPPVLGGYDIYTPSYGYGYPSYGYAPYGGFGAGSYSGYGGFNRYGAYGGFSGTGWGGAF